MDVTCWLERAEKALALESKRLRLLRILWLDVYAYYGETPSKERLDWYAQDTLDFGVDEVEAAMGVWRQTPPPEGHRPRPPLPVDILKLLRPAELSREDRANSIAALIFAAVGRYGRPNARRAQEKLGPEAWGVVEEIGGWSNLCATLTAERRDTFHAQTRDVAKGVLARSERLRRPLRGLQAAPDPRILPSPERSELKSFGEVADNLRKMGLGDVLERIGGTA